MRVANTRLLAALVVSLSASGLAWPQDLIRDIQGELTTQPGQSLYGYTVTLVDMRSRGEIDRADVDAFGYFTLHGGDFREYMVRVRDGNNSVVREEFLSSGSHTGPVRINIIPAHSSQPAGKTVSVTQLRHPPDKKAVKAFYAANRLSEAHEYARAAEELEKAIRISPEFAEAHTNLAVQRWRMGRFEQAASEFRRAMDLSSPNPRDLCNLAAALWALNRLPEALKTAEEALNLDSGFARAHFIVGSLLLPNPDTRAEGIRHLRIAAPEVPLAAKTLKRISQALVIATR